MLQRLAAHAQLLRVAAASFVIAGVVWTASTRGLATALLVVAAGALLVVIALVWSSVQSLTGEAPLTLDDALGLAAPRAEEEQKRAVLRALKDLEYERSVGKITEEDYAQLSARYRQQAKELLRSLDESLSPSRDRAASLVEKRLARSGDGSANPKKRKRKFASARATAEDLDDVETEPLPPAEDESVPSSEVESAASERNDDTDIDDDMDDDSDDDAETQVPPRAAPTRRCLECDVRNELDARFCKGCGKAMAAEGEHACTACPARYDATRETCPDCGVRRSDS